MFSGQVSAQRSNSGSGYRAGIQTVVNVGVQTDGEPSLQFIEQVKQLVVVTLSVLPLPIQELVIHQLIHQNWYLTILIHMTTFLFSIVLLWTNWSW